MQLQQAREANLEFSTLISILTQFRRKHSAAEEYKKLALITQSALVQSGVQPNGGKLLTPQQKNPQRQREGLW